MRKTFIAAAAGLVLSFAGVALAQTALPEGVTEDQLNSALKDLSAVYGASVVRLDQAKAICNEEQYVVDCAEIGQKHNLYKSDRAEQVNTLLKEFKGEVVEKMKQCEDAACLVDVATSIASRLSSNNPAVARTVELTPQKVKEKRTIVDTAKSLGVDIEACRTMDPDTAPVELLRGCAKLAKHENVQKFVPQEVKDRADETDAVIALRENLAAGQVSCGDGTLEGCGRFCLSPSSEARAQGTSAIPPVCREIASRFFGEEGVEELENAYTDVQKTFTTLADRAQTVALTTPDGQTLIDPAAIGRYLEDAGSRGDVEAVSRGMDFLTAKGLVTESDRDFALSMVRKVKEIGPVDFDACRTDPSRCANVIPEGERQQFAAMGEIDKVMRSEMASRGVSDPSVCSYDPSKGEACLEAARAALSQVEKLAGNNPQAQRIVNDIRQKVRFGEAGMEARERIERQFQTVGDVTFGEQRFSSFGEMESYCRTNPEQCLSETAREGFISKDIAAEKYERVIETQYRIAPPPLPPGGDVIGAPPEDRGGFDANKNKEEALQKFKQWLDNPQGPPPMPSPRDVGLYSRYSPYPTYPPYPQDPNRYQYPRPPVDVRDCVYPAVVEPPCKSGEYRQEYTDEFGCPQAGSCIPIDTRTEPPREDGRTICPALPTVNSCPSGQEKVISFSSPECGTYYACQATAKPPIEDQYRTTVSCERYGSGWRALDSSGNCFSPSMMEYRTPSGALMTCATSPVYGCGASDVPPAYQQQQPPAGQREQTWNSKGLRSWIRTDADPTRIESLKSACANVSSGANVWLPGAGTFSNSDFGMPDSAKCARAASCTSTQYFNGDSCTDSTSTNYQNTGSMKRCSYPNASRSGTPLGTVWCEADYYNCHEGGPSGVTVSVSGLSLGAPSNCESGWSNVTTSCPSGQYWNGTACTTSTTQTTTTGSCSSDLIGLLGNGCHSMGSAWFNEAMTSYVMSGSQTVRSCASEYISGCTGGTAQTQSYTSCPSGQYWNGTACTTSVTQTSQTSCGSGQYWDGSTCVSSSPSQSSTSCGPGQYWDSRTNSCQSMQTACSEAGGTWDSSSNYCRMPSSPTYTAPSSDTSSTYTAPSSGSTAPAPTGSYTPPPTTGSYTPPPTTESYTPPPTTESYTPPPTTGSYTPPPTTGSYTPPPTTGSYTPPPTTTTESAPISYLFCPEGHDWNGAYCTLSPPSPFERYTASVWSAARSLLGL